MSSEVRRWWREPIAWLVFGIPLATLIAGFWTLRIAAGDSATDAAPEQVRRTAQVQVSDLAADEAAARMGLSARLQHGADGSTLQLSGDIAAEPLWLDVVHPVESDRDVRIALQPAGEGQWRGTALPDPGVAWHLRLTPADGQWRLVGRIETGQHDTALQPAISAQ